jgi:hypothetical protein
MVISYTVYELSMYYIIILYHIYIPHVQTNRCPELANDTHATHLRLPHLRKHLIFHGQKLAEIEGSPPITQNLLKPCVYIICAYIYINNMYTHIIYIFYFISLCDGCCLSNVSILQNGPPLIAKLA